MTNKKFDCYSCQYRGTIPGDAHSCCNHPEAGTSDPLGNLLALFASVGRSTPITTKGASKLNIKGSNHGVRNGWFNWPFNFDPIWLENCDGYKKKENL